MNRTRVIIISFVVLAVLHQDFWNWDNANLVFGVMPVALAYHAAYSLVAALFWYLVMKFAWPSALEEWADGGVSPVVPKNSATAARSAAGGGAGAA